MKFLKIMAAVLVFAFTICMFAGCDQGGANSGVKINATIILVPEDGTEIQYDINVSEGLTIRQALYEAKLIDEENSVSLFVNTIDGHTANAIEDGVTWIPCDKNGEDLPATISGAVCAFDASKVSDGQIIKIVYTVVPNFDD